MMVTEFTANTSRVLGRTGRLLIILVLLVSFAIGARGLNADLVWADELATLKSIGAYDGFFGPAEVLDSLSVYSIYDLPLFFIVGAIWAQLGGLSPFALRMLPLWGGILMMSWLYRFVTDAISRRAAVVATILMGTNVFVLTYFHELRPYTFLILFSAAHLSVYWRVTHKRNVDRFTGFMFIATATALLYTHTFSVVLFVGIALFHLIFRPKILRWWQVVTGWGTGIAIFLPYLWGFANIARDLTERARPALVADLIGVGAKVIVNGCEWLWIPLVISIGYAAWRTHNSSVAGLLVTTMAMIIALVVIQQQLSVFAVTRLRYSFAAWPVIITLFAAGLTSLPRWRVFTLLFLVAWTTCGFEFVRTDSIHAYAGFAGRTRLYPPLNNYVYYLHNNVGPRDFLVGFTALEQLNSATSHSGQSVSDYYLVAQLGIDGTFLHTNLKRYRLAEDVREILRDHPHVLLAHDPSDVPLNYTRAFETIRAQYIPCAVLVDNPDLRIQRYVHPVLGCGHEPAPIEFDNGIKVVDHAARYAPESDRVEVLTWWQVPEDSMLHEFNISLQILTAELQNVRQLDRHLYDDLLPWNTIELSTVGLPKGTYKVVLILYNRMTGEKANRKDGAASIVPVLTVVIND